MKLSVSSRLVLLSSALAGLAGCSDDVPRPVAVIATGLSVTASADAGTCNMVTDTVQTAIGQAPQIHGGCSSTSGGRTPHWSWSVIDHPTGSVATIADTHVISPTFVPDVAGEYILGLVVDDGFQNSDEVRVVINAAGYCGYGVPVASASVSSPNATATACGGAAVPVAFPTNCGGGNQSCYGSGDILLDGTASSDPDNVAACGMAQNLFYSWTLLTAPYDPAQGGGGGGGGLNSSHLLSTDGATTVLRASYNGTYTVRLIVTDSTGRSGPEQVCTVEVTGLN